MYKGVAVVNFVNVISGHSIFLSELFRNEKVVNCVLLDETLRFSNKPCPVFKKRESIAVVFQPTSADFKLIRF